MGPSPLLTMDARSEVGSMHASAASSVAETEAHSHTTADTVARMKAAIIRKKGRGFDTDVEHTEYSEYDRLEDDDEELDGLDTQEGPGPQRSVEGWIIFVRGLHEETAEDDIMDRFSDYGEVKNLHLNLDRRTGFMKGYALVEYGTYKEAYMAKQELDGTEILGQTINVDWAFVKGPHYTKQKRPV